MSMGHFWDGTSSGNPKHLDKNVYQCHIIHHKSHMDWAGIWPESPQWDGEDQPHKPHRLQMDDTFIFQFSVSLQYSKQLISLI